MSTISKVFASLAALLHVGFFCMESLFWMQPAVHTRFRVETLEEAEVLAFALFNQGFYNLFVALGCIAGLVLIQKGRESQGVALVVYTCLFMLGAALVLGVFEPSLFRSAMMQGGPPLLALLTHWFTRKRGR